MSRPYLVNVFIPALRAIQKYLHAQAIRETYCPSDVCDANRLAQINRAYTQAEASIDRAASNLP